MGGQLPDKVSAPCFSVKERFLMWQRISFFNDHPITTTR
jgi:hypothetical protein